jgi:hypothetical protein
MAERQIRQKEDIKIIKESKYDRQGNDYIMPQVLPCKDVDKSNLPVPLSKVEPIGIDNALIQFEKMTGIDNFKCRLKKLDQK